MLILIEYSEWSFWYADVPCKRSLSTGNKFSKFILRSVPGPLTSPMRMGITQRPLALDIPAKHLELTDNESNGQSFQTNIRLGTAAGRGSDKYVHTPTAISLE